MIYLTTPDKTAYSPNKITFPLEDPSLIPQTSMSNYAIYEDGRNALETKVTEFIYDLAAKSIKDHDAFIIALSGGSLATFLGRLKFPEEVEMSKWHVFLVDERAVPLDHSDSNYKTIREAWNDSLKCKWYPAMFDEISLEQSAKMYEEDIKQVFDQFKVNSFDLLLLGLGPDGHTASLFPSHPDFLKDSEDRIVISVNDSPKPPKMRISLSPTTIRCSKASAFIITGSASKAPIIKSILLDKDPQYPPTTVAPNAFWFLDKTSASYLQ